MSRLSFMNLFSYFLFLSLSRVMNSFGSHYLQYTLFHLIFSSHVCCSFPYHISSHPFDFDSVPSFPLFYYFRLFFVCFFLCFCLCLLVSYFLSFFLFLFLCSYLSLFFLSLFLFFLSSFLPFLLSVFLTYFLSYFLSFFLSYFLSFFLIFLGLCYAES